MEQPICEVSHLHVEFTTTAGSLKAVDDVSFAVHPGECLGIVGESGSGKSVTCRSIIGLIEPPGRIVSGEIQFAGRSLLQLTPGELEEIRGKEISMIFQDPLTSLNPIFTVEEQITSVIKRHWKCTHREARERAVAILGQVGVPSPADRMRQYPFQLSGGLRQRVMIAMALSCEPKLVIADEPTTALDVSIQAQILDLLRDLKSNLRFSLIFVSHDLGVVANISDRVMVMYAGKVVEVAPIDQIFSSPTHPYTVGLLNSAPSLDSYRGQPLQPIEGILPDLTQVPPGCPFAPRCLYRSEECDRQMPPLEARGAAHFSACYHPLKAAAHE